MTVTVLEGSGGDEARYHEYDSYEARHCAVMIDEVYHLRIMITEALARDEDPREYIVALIALEVRVAGSVSADSYRALRDMLLGADSGVSVTQFKRAVNSMYGNPDPDRVKICLKRAYVLGCRGKRYPGTITIEPWDPSRSPGDSPS